jgi:hypothetical protein
VSCILLNGQYYEVVVEHYARGNNMVSLLEVPSREPYMVVSVNDTSLDKDEVAIKDYSAHQVLLNSLLNAEVLEEPHRLIQSGLLTLPVCRLKVN